MAAVLACDPGAVASHATAAWLWGLLRNRPGTIHVAVPTSRRQRQPFRLHFAALAACFPGGSITGAPKIRAMEIIDELEPLSRGPYCGCHGYLGFNRESHLSITIRTAICKDGLVHFNVGAGIVADSNPEAEYEETLAKAAGFLAALKMDHRLIVNAVTQNNRQT